MAQFIMMRFRPDPSARRDVSRSMEEGEGEVRGKGRGVEWRRAKRDFVWRWIEEVVREVMERVGEEEEEEEEGAAGRRTSRQVFRGSFKLNE